MPQQTELHDIIIRELDLKKLPAADQAQVVARISRMIEKAILAEIFSRLPASAKDEYEQIEATGDGVQMNTFLTHHIPGLKDLAANEIRRILNEYKKALA